MSVSRVCVRVCGGIIWLTYLSPTLRDYNKLLIRTTSNMVVRGIPPPLIRAPQTWQCVCECMKFALVTAT